MATVNHKGYVTTLAGAEIQLSPLRHCRQPLGASNNRPDIHWEEEGTVCAVCVCVCVYVYVCVCVQCVKAV